MSLENKFHGADGINVTNKTQKWYAARASEDSNPLIYFYRPPMIFTAYTSGRVLFVGTKEQANHYLQRVNGKNVNGISSSCYVSFFWEDFFGTKRFLDTLEGRTVPSRIISTGFIELSPENKEMVFIGHFLKNLARKWEISFSKRKYL